MLSCLSVLLLLYPSQLFQLNGSLHEWDFRSRLDRFAAPCGMLLGLGWILLFTRPANRRAKPSQSDGDSVEHAAGLAAESPLSPWESLHPLTRLRARYAAYGTAAAVFITYIHFALNCHNKVS